MKKNISIKALAFLLFTGLSAMAYEIWEPQPAPNYGDVGGITMMRGRNYDEYWERWSYPIGNGTMGLTCLDAMTPNAFRSPTSICTTRVSTSSAD